MRQSAEGGTNAGQKKAQPARVALEVPPKEEVLEEYVDWRRRKPIIPPPGTECKRSLLLSSISACIENFYEKTIYII
jgi:hypothetical protein